MWRAVSAVAIFLTAVALQRACTLPWARASSAVGGQFALTVVGLSHVAGTADRTPTDCRWWPHYGDAALCGPRVSNVAAYQSLRLAYPLLQAAMWLSIVSVMLQALRVPRQRLLQAIVPAAVAVLTGAAIVYVVRGARDGLAALDGMDIAFQAAGYHFATAAAVLSLVSTIILLTTFSVGRRPDPVGAPS